MQLLNEFEVALPPERTWTLLTDLEKVAPCLPGASITSVEGEDFHGQAKIKVGPITAQYKGTARFTELDAGAHRAVLLARGKDARGQGDATATVTATLAPMGSGTRVLVETDLALTGKVAQFGRGVLADVSGHLMTIFAHQLEAMVAAESAGTEEGATHASWSGSSPGASTTYATSEERNATSGPGQPVSAGRAAGQSGQDEVLDLLALAGGMPWAKALPAGGTVVAVVAAFISVFAAGYASARAKSIGH